MLSDIFTPDVRCCMRWEIQGKNANPVIAICLILHRVGFRLRAVNLFWKLGLLFRKYWAATFDYGCFSRRLDRHLLRWRSSRCNIRRTQVDGNITSDRQCSNALSGVGWRVAVLWVRALRDRAALRSVRWRTAVPRRSTPTS